MAKKSFIVYQNWAEIIKRLPVKDAGELIQAICNHATGTESEITNPVIEAIYEGQIKPQMDADADKYAETVERRTEAGKKGGSQRWQNSKCKAKDSKCYKDDGKTKQNIADTVTDTDTDTDTVTDTVSPSEINKITPKPPKRGKGASEEILNGMVDTSNLSEPVKAKVKEWIQYKQERREPYQETGFRNLLTQIFKHEVQIGSEAVINAISISMGNSWKGIIWDAVKSPPSKKFNATAYILDQLGG